MGGVHRVAEFVFFVPEVGLDDLGEGVGQDPELVAICRGRDGQGPVVREPNRLVHVVMLGAQAGQHGGEFGPHRCERGEDVAVLADVMADQIDAVPPARQRGQTSAYGPEVEIVLAVVEQRVDVFDKATEMIMDVGQAAGDGRLEGVGTGGALIFVALEAKAGR